MPTDTQSRPAAAIQIIRKSEWEPHAAALKHVFLAGNLQRPVPHPFLRRTDAEIIWCDYQAGDNGRPHWHAEVDEIEIVLRGRIGCRDIATGEVIWFEAGDLLSVSRGVCVERIIAEPTQTLAVKLPSRQDKVHCRDCDRTCAQRREEFQHS